MSTPGTIPGASLEFYVRASTPYDVRVRFKSGGNGGFDWQADILSADWQALIAAITGLVGTAAASYTVPNATYASVIKFAGAVPPNDITT